MLCSRSVHDSRLLVIVYGLRVFDASGCFMVDGRGRSQTNPSRETAEPTRAARYRPSPEARSRPPSLGTPRRDLRLEVYRPERPACVSRARATGVPGSSRALFSRARAFDRRRRRVRIRASGRARELNRATLGLTAGRGGGLEADARLSDVRSRVVQLCRRPDAA
jgi:hypothetical protein